MTSPGRFSSLLLTIILFNVVVVFVYFAFDVYNDVASPRRPIASPTVDDAKNADDETATKNTTMKTTTTMTTTKKTTLKNPATKTTTTTSSKMKTMKTTTTTTTTTAESYKGPWPYPKRYCEPPLLSPFPLEIKRLYDPKPLASCDDVEKDWVRVVGGKFVFRDHLARNHSGVRCRGSKVERNGDHAFKLINVTEDIVNGTSVPVSTFVLYCNDSTGSEFQTVLNTLVPTEKRVKESRDRLKNPRSPLPRANPRAQPPDVVVLGLDSMSRQAWKRYLPKTYDYFMGRLGGMAVHGLNTLGENSPYNIVPFLVGKHFDYSQDNKTADGLPLIWKNFSTSGYLTVFSESDSYWATFCREQLSGFKGEPTDYYGRPNYQVLDLAHDRNNDAGFAADEIILEFLLETEDDGTLNNTILILMSDHGSRLDGYRGMITGALEQRQPLIAFRFPPWFEENYPTFWRNFRRNAQSGVVVTHLDVHATLLHLTRINESSFDLPFTTIPGKTAKAHSLFQIIPKNRTCGDADIPPPYCACIPYKPVNQDKKEAEDIGRAFTRMINEKILSPHQNRCVFWELKTVDEGIVADFPEDLEGYKPKLVGYDGNHSNGNHSNGNISNGNHSNGDVNDVKNNERESAPDAIFQVQVTMTRAGARFHFSGHRIGGRYRIDSSLASRISKCLCHDKVDS